MGDPSEWLRRLDRRAELRSRAGLTRQLEPRGPQFDGIVDLAGNDYLGLARHSDVIAAAIGAVADYGLGATGSRLVRGSTEVHCALENELAVLLRQPAALVFSSGYLANLGAIRAIVQPRTQVLIDAHAHASLFDGCRLSGARTHVLPHADLGALGDKLREIAGQPVLVVTESVFSVDGDLAPLRGMHAACRKAGAILLIDDAHAVGVVGEHGAGAVADAGLAGEPDVVVTATLSKAVGAAGGVVAASRSLIGHLVDTGRTFMYDTALAPMLAAGARAGVALLSAADEPRALVRSRAHHAARTLRAAKLEVSEPAAGIVSLTATGSDATVAWARRCLDRGVAVGCFRPPSTPDSRSRLRLTINAGVATPDFERGLDVVVATAP